MRVIFDVWHFDRLPISPMALKAVIAVVRRRPQKRCVARFGGFCAQLFLPPYLWRILAEAEAVGAAAASEAAAATAAAAGRTCQSQLFLLRLSLSVGPLTGLAGGQPRRPLLWGRAAGKCRKEGRQLKEGRKGRIPFLGNISALERLQRLQRLRDGDWGWLGRRKKRETDADGPLTFYTPRNVGRSWISFS